MPNALLDRLRSEFTDLESQIHNTQAAASDSERDLSEAENANCQALLERAETLRPRIEHLVAQEETFQATQSALSRVSATQAPSTEERSVEVLRSMYPSVGHYLSDLFRTGRHGWVKPGESHIQTADVDAVGRLRKAHEISRALANQTTADNPGILPVPIVGDVLNLIDASRPVFSSFTQRPMPSSGRTFNRPIINQHTLVGKQSAEKTEIPSQKMTISSIALTKQTFGGALDISVQDVDWTDPTILSIAVADLGDQYALQTEADASAVLAAVTQTQAAATADAPGLLAAIAAAAGKVYAGAKRLPDRLWASVDVWGKLVGLPATDGRQAFPGIGATNTSGSVSEVTTFTGAVLGLPLVVGPALPASTLIVGCSRYAEAYEDRRGAVRAFEVSLLGWEVGYYGYAVEAILVANAFCKVTGLPAGP